MFATTRTDLAGAWLEAVEQLLLPGVNEITPLVARIEDFRDGAVFEDQLFEAQLDEIYANTNSSRRCHSTANTIFPNTFWRASTRDRGAHVYERYARIWPRLQRFPENRRGTYFRRMTAFRSDTGNALNQVDHIIRTYRSGNHRRSALQIACFDPALDLTNQRRQGFPCLQHIAFAPVGNELRMTAFYAVQYVFDRAYGNWLGLCRLGRFVAANMGLRMRELTCIANVALRGNISKRALRLAIDRQFGDRQCT